MIARATARILLIVLASAAVVTAQKPAATTADVSGVVRSSAADSRPVRGAIVVIAGVGTGGIRITETNDAGSFMFAGLPPGRYLISAGKASYLTTTHGARRDSRPGTPIVLAAGQHVRDVVLMLSPGAAITGRVVDEAGQPVAGARMRVLPRRTAGDEITLAGEVGSPATATTDDRGMYHVFDLPAGDYVVAVQPRGVAGPEVRMLTAADIDGTGGGTAPPAAAVHAPVYYPGAARATDAAVITLAPGEERAGIDLRTTLSRLSRVAGVVRTNGTSASNVQIVLRPSGANATGLILNQQNQRPAADGRFAFNNVVPGEYTLLARTLPPPQQQGDAFAPTPPGADAPQGPRAQLQWAIASVSVAGTNVDNVTLTMQPALTISGRVTVEGGGAAAMQGVRIGVRATPSTGAQAATDLVVVDTTGAFTLRGLLPGRYWIYAQVPATDAVTQIADWIPRSAIVDGIDAMDVPIELGPNRRTASVAVTLTGEFQEVIGSVSAAPGKPLRGQTIVAFPTDRRFWFPQSRRIAIRQTDSQGQFVFGIAAALPPGDYFIAAVTEPVLQNEQFDSAVLGALVPGAAHVTLAAGDSKRVIVK